MGSLSHLLNSGRSDYFRFEFDYGEESYIKGMNITEAINAYGICFTYYIRTYDSSYDKIFGEDNNCRYTRSFEFMGMCKLPTENKFFTQFGIEHTEDFSVYSSKMHFVEASTDKQTGKDYIPQIGDVIEVRYSQFLYEITSVPVVSDFSYFQNGNLVWEFVVKPFKNEHIEVDANIPEDSTIRQHSDPMSDIFDIRNIVDTKKEEILFVPSPTEAPQRNPFANW